MTHIKMLLIAGTAVLGLFGNADAQAGPMDCATAISTLNSGSVTVIDSQAVALLKVSGCGQAGVSAFATSLRRRSTQTTFETYGIFFGGVFSGDTAVMNAALDIATDPAAAPGPRSAALAILDGYATNRRVPSFKYFAELADGDFCGGHEDPSVSFNPYSPNTLPSNIVATIKARIAPIERDASQPLLVRVAANCVMNEWRASQQLPIEPSTTVNNPVQIEYLCQTRFRVKNSVPFSVKAQFRVGASGPLTTFDTQPAHGAVFGYSELHTDLPNTPVSLYFDGQLVNTAYPTTATCP